MIVLNIQENKAYALYHFLEMYPELYGKQLTEELLLSKGFQELTYAPLPVIKGWQRLVVGPIVNAVQTWEVEDIPLDDLRSTKVAKINQWRDERNMEPVEFSGHLFDNDPESQFRVLAIVILGTGSPTGYWTTADNKDVLADATFMQGLYGAMLTKMATTHHQQREMKKQIESLGNPEVIYGFQVGGTND